MSTRKQKMNMEQTNIEENPLILVSQKAAIDCTKTALLGEENCIELHEKSRLCKQACTNQS